MKKFKLIFSAVVFTALFAGCGNSGDDPTPGPDPKPEGKEFHGVVLQLELPILKVVAVMCMCKHYQVFYPEI